jgi:hypothetical protein
MDASAPSFGTDIKPLFRDRDRKAMTFLFDLWNYDDAKANSAAILTAVEGGEMPCDGSWSPEQIDLLRRWIGAGAQP